VPFRDAYHEVKGKLDTVRIPAGGLALDPAATPGTPANPGLAPLLARAESLQKRAGAALDAEDAIFADLVQAGNK
jgi:hypothetical protein